MKKKRLFAFLLTLALLVQFTLPVMAAEGDPTPADTWAEITQNAAVHYDFEGDDRVFDGTRTVDKTADLAAVSGLTQGTIIVRARFTGTVSASTFFTLLGFGNPTNDSTGQIVLGADGNPFSARYEFGTGLYSTAMKSVPYSDGKWHTLAFTAGDGYVSVSVDGASGSTGGDGYYRDSKWNGFMTRGKSLDSFTIGGFSSPNYRLHAYGNWVGEIDFVTITSEVLAPAEANEITGMFNSTVEIGLNSQPIATPETIGSTVGTVAFTGAGAEGCTASLPAGLGDNALFTLEGNVLKTAAVLDSFASYTVVVAAGLPGVENERFTVTTLGDASGLLLAIDQTTSLTTPVPYPALVAPAATLNDLTIKAQFVQTNGGIGSIIGFSNGGEKARHLHLYANGSTIGYELRGTDVADMHSSAPALRSGGLNTVAFKADSATNTFKIFANGELVSTRQMDATTYRMLKDLVGLNAVSVGGTPRDGNSYPFTGTLLGLEVHGSALNDADLLAYTAATAPEEGGGSTSPHIFEGTGSQYYRIPALYTLADGTVMAAVDARFGGASDSPNNLDTGINFLAPGASVWGTATMPFHFADYSDEPGYAGGSASFIDPVIAQGSDGTIYLMVDAFPSGYGYPNCATGTGMTTVNGEKVLALTQRGNSINQWSNFNHYVKGGVIYTADGTATEYTMDEHFNLYKNGEPLYVAQKRAAGGTSGRQVPMNVFYADADFKVFATSYLMLITSTDGGQTWSAPRNMNYLKRDIDRFWGTGPGRGHTVQVGDYAGRVLLPTYDSQDGERASVIYSDDNGVTWTRGARTTMAASNSPGKSSESQLIELPDGTLRLFARGNTGRIGYADSFDGGATFQPMQQDTGLAYCGNVMISVINYDGLIDGKPALILSCPEGSGRNNGIIRIGLINENEPGAAQKYSIDWKYKYAVNQGGFVYSCLTQLPDGNIGLLWECNPNNMPCLYSVYTIDELKAGAKSAVDTFALQDPDTAIPGSTLRVQLTLQSRVVEELSSLDTATLSIDYPGSEHPAGTLTFSELLPDGKTLVFTGTAPSGDAGYGFRVSIPAGNTIFTLNGAFTPIASDLLVGVINHPVDFDPLAALVAELETRNEQDYTPATWGAFNTALQAAKTIAEEKTATQAQVTEAYEALNTAAAALAARANKQNLANTIETLSTLAELDYTADSWASFASSMAAASAVLANDNATQAEVAQAEAALFIARLGLVRAADKSYLLAAIDLAAAIDTTDCTEGTVAALAEALTAATAVANDRNATSGQVADALSSLLTAVSGLKEAGDKTALTILHEAGLTALQDKYTPASWAPFADAMLAAKACLDDPEAGQEDVDLAYAVLYNALISLTDRADTSSLQALADRAQTILTEPEKYAPATLAGLEEALAAVLPVLDNADATQTEVNTVGQALLNILNGVRLQADKSGLRQTVAFAAALDMSAYLPETVTPLTATLASAQTLLDDENALQENVDSMELELLRLIALLAKPAPTPPPAEPDPAPQPPAPSITAPNTATPRPSGTPSTTTSTPVAATTGNETVTPTPAPAPTPDAPATITSGTTLPQEPTAPLAPTPGITPAQIPQNTSPFPWLLLILAIALALSLMFNFILLAKLRKKEEEQTNSVQPK